MTNLRAQGFVINERWCTTMRCRTKATATPIKRITVMIAKLIAKVRLSAKARRPPLFLGIPNRSQNASSASIIFIHQCFRLNKINVTTAAIKAMTRACQKLLPRPCSLSSIGCRAKQGQGEFASVCAPPLPYPSPPRRRRGGNSGGRVTQGCTPSSFTLGYNQVIPTGFQFAGEGEGKKSRRRVNPGWHSCLICPGLVCETRFGVFKMAGDKKPGCGAEKVEGVVNIFDFGFGERKGVL